MTDLLTHVLLAYAIARLLSWHYDWLSSGYVTAVMVGALIPELVKIKLVLTNGDVQSLVGLPFVWDVFQTAGGALVAVLIGVTVVAPRERARAFALLSVGAASHLAIDALHRSPSGQSYPVLWPLSRYHPPTPGLYLSTQAEPTVVAAIGAITVWLATRRLQS